MVYTQNQVQFIYVHYKKPFCVTIIYLSAQTHDLMGQCRTILTASIFNAT